MKAVQQCESRLLDIPGPPGSPLLGNALDFRRDLLGTLMRGLHEYGDVVRYPVGPPGPLRRQLVVVHDPHDVQQVLTQTERTFSKDTRVLAEMLGRGLLTSRGTEWRRQRRMLQPLFTPQRVAGYLGLMAEEAALVARSAPTDGRQVDVHLLMMRYTLRVVGRALFGDDIEDIVPKMDRLVAEGSAITRRRMFQTVRVPLSWRLPTNRRARMLRATQYAVVDEILRRTSGQGNPPYDADRENLVTHLRAVTDPETGGRLSDTELRDQVLIFLLAGHETTAGALTFTLYLLGRHLDVQEEVAAEAQRVLGDDDLVTTEQLAELALTRAALQEGMRLYPSAHATHRVTVEPVEVGGYVLPARQLVIVSPWTTQRHPSYWPDPERFDPGRFLGDRSKDRPHYAYFPFGGGPRACVGEHFAMMEAVTLLSMLLRHRRVRAVRSDLPVAPNVTLRPVGEVPTTFEKR